MKIRPLHDNVLVKRLDEESKSRGGIIIPDTAKEKPVQGKVVAVGTGKILEGGRKVPLTIKTGDKVLFTKFGGTEIKISGEEHIIMSEDDILAIMD